MHNSIVSLSSSISSSFSSIMFGLVDSLTLTKSRRTQTQTTADDDDMMLMDDDAMIDAMMINQTTTASTDNKNNKNNGSSSIRPGRRGVRRGYQAGASISSSYTMTEDGDSTVIKMIVPTKTQDGPSSSPTLQKPVPPKQ